MPAEGVGRALVVRLREVRGVMTVVVGEILYKI
jgi:hypothetical protein